LSYDDFMQRVLEPLPAEELLDIPYNKLVRAEIWERWRKAEVITGFYSAALHLDSAHESLSQHMEPREFADLLSGLRRIDRAALVKEWRRYLATQLVTPAPDGEALKWKRAQLRKEMRHYSGGWYLPINEDEIRAAIDADERFLAAHPRRRKSAREREQQS
jgi:hypothetical protein